MTKEYFKIENCTKLKDIKPGGKVHFIGVCGVAMGQLAVALSQAGFKVSGSDKTFYEPMGSFLKNSQLKLFLEYDSNNIQDYDLVVIGNAISYPHPEVLKVEEKKIPYTFFSKLLYEYLIADTKAITVCGTHGKTTTTSLIAQVLENLNLNPSYFIGGVVPNLPLSLKKGTGGFSVVEGDEYDSAFFAKTPKFHFYHPTTCIINAIEFDHSDIYSNINEIKSEFDKLVNSISNNGKIIVNLDCEEIFDSLDNWKVNSKAKIITFGENLSSDYIIKERRYLDCLQLISVEFEQKSFVIKTPLIGLINARNSLATYICLKEQGVDSDAILKSLSNSQSVRRRNEIFLEKGNSLFIEDFAHHPTAVRETLLALKEVYKEKKIIALFEPASNTSRKKVFENDYQISFSLADDLIILKPKLRENEDSKDLLDLETFVKNIRIKGNAYLFNSSDEIIDYLKSNFNTKENALYILMSNSSFDALKFKILNKL